MFNPRCLCLDEVVIVKEMYFFQWSSFCWRERNCPVARSITFLRFSGSKALLFRNSYRFLIGIGFKSLRTLDLFFLCWYFLLLIVAASTETVALWPAPGRLWQSDGHGWRLGRSDARSRRRHAGWPRWRHERAWSTGGLWRFWRRTEASSPFLSREHSNYSNQHFVREFNHCRNCIAERFSGCEFLVVKYWLLLVLYNE